jgi:hypothetical protein
MKCGWRWDGRISTAVSVLSLSVDRSRVAVSHSPLPAICWRADTHRSTATGVNNAVTVPWDAFAGQPAQAAPPAGIIGPPLTVGTGVALAAAPGAEAEPEADPDAEPAADAEPDADAGAAAWSGPPGLAATVPHPAARAPATSSGNE